MARLTPYDWQQADIDRLVATMTPDIGGLVVSAPGAGKTLVAVEVMARFKPAVTLIVAPQSTHESWDKTLRNQGVSDGARILIGTAPGKRAFADLQWSEPGVYITSPQWFVRQQWGHIDLDMVVFDEIHQVTKYGNVSQKRLLGERKKRGLWAPLRLGLSGTPFRNNFENAWSLVRWIEPTKMPKDFWLWRVQDCATKYDHFAPQNAKVVGELRPGALAGSLSCLIVHYQREKCCEYHPNGFLGHLAPPIHVERDLRMTKAQAAFYSSMEDTYIAYLTTPDAETGKVPVVAELPVTARGMLRFCALGLPSYNEETEKLYFELDCESPKVDALIEDIGNLDGKRVLVFTHSRQFADVLAHRLTEAGFRTAAWKGGLSKKRRAEIKQQFIDDELDVIVGVISAMGTGTDGLQEAAYNVAWVSVDDDASNDTQGIGRLDRLGQKHQVVMVEYRMIGTYDVGHLPKMITTQLKINQSLRAKK